MSFRRLTETSPATRYIQKVNTTNNLDYKLILKRAIGPIARRGPTRFTTRDELEAMGLLAIAKKQAEDGPISEALAVTVARRAMLNHLRDTQREIREAARLAGLEVQPITDQIMRHTADDEPDPDGDEDSWSAEDRKKIVKRFQKSLAVDVPGRTENKSRVQAEMNKLTKKQRDVLLMKLKTATKEQEKGATEKQIAVKLRTSQPTVSRLVRSAEAALRGSLRNPIPSPTLLVSPSDTGRKEPPAPETARTHPDPTRPPLRPPIASSK